MGAAKYTLRLAGGLRGGVCFETLVSVFVIFHCIILYCKLISIGIALVLVIIYLGSKLWLRPPTIFSD